VNTGKKRGRGEGVRKVLSMRRNSKCSSLEAPVLYLLLFYRHSFIHHVSKAVIESGNGSISAEGEEKKKNRREGNPPGTPSSRNVFSLPLRSFLSLSVSSPLSVGKWMEKKRILGKGGKGGEKRKGRNICVADCGALWPNCLGYSSSPLFGYFASTFPYAQ